MKSNYKNTVGILGLIISFFGTIFFGLGTIYRSEESFSSSSFLICIIGIILLVWWLKHVKRIGIKIAMIILLIGQLLIFLFPESIFRLDGNYGNNMTFFVFIVFLIGITLSIKSIRKRYKIRQNFSKSIKNQILQKQKHKCVACKKMPPLFHFDHKDGNRSNNGLKNCQALCPNCHSIKTLRQIRR
ncbi:MAG TPA: HNH endonuclease signature motif containing protein [Nitrososphaeraceae archaeon]|nr:HNH endonuclease signature motif containing protein [Nitrososphaeraceae archaeon]